MSVVRYTEPKQSGAELATFLVGEKELVSSADGQTVAFVANAENQPRVRKFKEKSKGDVSLSGMLSMLNKMAA